jgi:spore germination protein YaaH
MVPDDVVNSRFFEVKTMNLRPISSMLRYLITFVCALIIIPVSCVTAQQNPAADKLQERNPAVLKEGFGEIWAYLMQGEEKDFSGNEPITDLCYFSAVINYKGELVGPKEIPGSVKLNVRTRTHLVICDLRNTSLLHFLLTPAYPLRARFMESLSAFAKNYDGVQIDFEAIHPDDADNYISFLSECKKVIGEKMLSVALPPRREYCRDPYDYERIGAIADRVIVMAYDEHWSTSKPGPIASLQWCGRVASYVKTKIPEGKAVMGVPFYGRAWQNERFDRALKYRMVEELAMKRDDLRTGKQDYPSFTYDAKVTVTVFFENKRTVLEKLELYRSMGFRSVGFWRIGQNAKDIWGYLSLEEEGAAKTDK